jgi:pheromone shutdown protein TraB
MNSIAFVFLLFNFWQDSSNMLLRVDTPTREVLIIGTVHRGNPQISSKSLLQILEKERPDVIFIESDTVSAITCKNNNVFGLEIASKLGIWRPSIEQRAVQRFAKRNKNVCIIPYDTVFARRSYIKDFVSRSETIFNRLDSLFEVGKMNAVDVERYNRYQILTSDFYNQLYEKDLKEINERSLLDSSRLMMKMKEEILPEFAARYIPEEENWVKENLAFDDRRNQFMGRYLLKSFTEIKHQKIIILTGLLHKYFLFDYLSPFEQEHHFKLVSLK